MCIEMGVGTLSKATMKFHLKNLFSKFFENSLKTNLEHVDQLAPPPLA